MRETASANEPAGPAIKAIAVKPMKPAEVPQPQWLLGLWKSTKQAPQDPDARRSSDTALKEMIACANAKPGPPPGQMEQTKTSGRISKQMQPALFGLNPQWTSASRPAHPLSP